MIPFLGAVLLAVASSAAAGPAKTAGRNPAAIRELAEGKRRDANAAWWGFDPVNATGALQSAIRSGAATVVVPNVGKPWIVDPIFLESDQEIDLEPGVEIEARRGGFQGKTDELFRIRDKTNVVLKGYGAVLRMHKEDYRSAPYAKAEWRACLGIHGGTNIKILGVSLADSGGDGIYIAEGDGEHPFSRNVLIKDVVSDNNYRQGISVISVSGLRIENSVLRGTEGTEPAAGIDFEPNGPTDRLTGIAMRNCVIEKNQRYGIQVGLERLPADFPYVDISIEGGRVAENGSGGLIVYPGKVKGMLSIRAVKLEGRRNVKPSRTFAVRVQS